MKPDTALLGQDGSPSSPTTSFMGGFGWAIYNILPPSSVIIITTSDSGNLSSTIHSSSSSADSGDLSVQCPPLQASLSYFVWTWWFRGSPILLDDLSSLISWSSSSSSPSYSLSTSSPPITPRPQPWTCSVLSSPLGGNQRSPPPGAGGNYPPSHPLSGERRWWCWWRWRCW